MFKYLNILRAIANRKKGNSIESTIVKRGLGIIIKATIVSLITSLVTLLLPILILIVVTILVYFLYLQMVTVEVNNQYGSTQDIVLGIKGSTFFRGYLTNGDAGNFDPTSPIPHGFPTTGRLSQGFCSNFYGFFGGLTYKATSRKLSFETYCQGKMAQDTRFKDFAQKYTGGDWTKVGAHGGIDIANRKGTDIYSMSKGQIIRVGKDSIWGNYIDIYSKDGETTYVVRYAHLDEIVKQEGDVYGGELIAYMGNTGKSTGAHLHLGICKNGEAFNDCYAGTAEMVDPLPYTFNYIVNGEEGVTAITNETEFIGKNVYAGTGNPGLVLNPTLNAAGSEFGNIDVNSPLTKDVQDYIYVKVAREHGIHPILLKALHYKEGGLRTTNPTPRSDAGYSGHNEGVYGMFSDFRKLTPYCIRSEENFGGFGRDLTVREFENQTECAARVLLYKFGKRADLLKEEVFSVENQNEKEEFCQGIRGYNAGPFYCWNNLYPTYTSDSSYTNMPVKAGGRILGYHRMDGILKYILDNQKTFEEVVQLYAMK